MRGALKLRLPNECWDDINNFRNRGDFKSRNAILVEAVHLGLIEITRQMERLGIIRSDTRQYRKFYRHDLILLNGHPSENSIEELFKESERARPEYVSFILWKHIRRAINRTMKREESE